ncbi:hypothetical protein PAESOLCIP111_04974 [Paenibacillus solanacearum]|uniref:YprB ribonuclease H-like domain-containing protein n=1 Tax=Paenibacillus solanacearum TaxID=2048548 RepID=A0A916K8Q6_9BACL|nr:ribonuclease H-like domain-containing protein [Paenibacillus solanacearum]CAG7645541.1 hypothetical protein PAESOLCIP111_04974 [Paenibacillus solanacearum]
MSSLKERLLRHKKPASALEPEVRGSDSAGVETEPELEAGTGTNAACGLASACVSAAAASDEWETVGGRMETTDWGSFVLRRRTYAPGYRHGKYRLSDLQSEGAHLRPLYLTGGRRREEDPTAKSVEEDPMKFHERLLFIDTETTGLGLGAGNVPFMVGIGFYEGGNYTVEQMLIRHPGEEIAMLAYLQEKLERYPIVISYNGKSFDWPIVKNRYIMNRMTLRAEPKGHIDFLYPSRSLWKHSLPSCRLGNVEEERLLVHREDDVPGSLAPALYFQYLAEKDPSVLHGVFIHNELDILSLAGLAVHFAGVLSGRIDWREVRPYGYEEWFRMGLWLDKVGMREAAEGAMDALYEASLRGETKDAAERRYDDGDSQDGANPANDTHVDVSTAETSGWVADAESIGRASLASGNVAGTTDGAAYWLPLAQYYKRLGRYADACRLWQRYIELKGEHGIASMEPYVELSMHYEHREKQWETARQYAVMALEKLRQRAALKMRQGSREKSGSGRSRVGASVSTGGVKGTDEVKEADALRKRIERLERKAAAAAANTVQKPRTKTKTRQTRAETGERGPIQAEQLALPLEQSV